MAYIICAAHILGWMIFSSMNSANFSWASSPFIRTSSPLRLNYLPWTWTVNFKHVDHIKIRSILSCPILGLVKNLLGMNPFWCQYQASYHVCSVAIITCASIISPNELVSSQKRSKKSHEKSIVILSCPAKWKKKIIQVKVLKTIWTHHINKACIFARIQK